MYVSQAYFHFAHLSGCSLYSLATQSVFCGPIAWESAGSLIKVWNSHALPQICGIHIRTLTSIPRDTIEVLLCGVCLLACLKLIQIQIDCIWRIPEYFLRCGPLEAIVLGVRRLGFWPPVMAKHPVLPWVSPVSTLHLFVHLASEIQSKCTRSSLPTSNFN